MFLFAQYNFAQKVVQKTYVNTNIEFVQIDVSQCFSVNISTADTNEMLIEATFDGEYKKDLLLAIEEQNSSILVETKFNPSFIHPNDKLSAHKVIAIDLKVVLPKNLNISVYGTSCNVVSQGVYKNLKVVLADGRCELVNVSETVNVITQKGNIEVRTKAAQFILENKYGIIKRDTIPQGNNLFNLTTTTGNIHLKKIE